MTAMKGAAMRTCEIDGCDRRHEGKGMCRRHYMKEWHRLGQKGRVARRAEELARRFPERVHERRWLGDECGGRYLPYTSYQGVFYQCDLCGEWGFPATRPKRRPLQALVAIVMAAAVMLVGGAAYTIDPDAGVVTMTASLTVRPGVAQPGGEYLLETIPSPDELVGVECRVAGASANGESVHAASYAELRSGSTARIEGTEDEAGGVHLVDRTLTVGSVIELWYVTPGRLPGEVPLGASIDLQVTLTCPTTPVTTTTVPDTTTTTTPATTTVPDTTTAPPTTVPATTTTPSTIVIVDEPPTVVTTVPPVTTPSTLPFTGPGDHLVGLTIAAVALITMGAGVLVSRRAT